MPAAAERPAGPAGQTSKALLPCVRKPADLDRFTSGQLVTLTSEIRQHLAASVTHTGDHLGPNLRVVGLTITLHRTFRSPRDTIVFDTGHRAYVHKLLTGRQDFTHLRERGGLSGYPSQAESVHDVVENSHVSTALSWADGIARTNHLQGHDERHVAAVIGDDAMTRGMAWEALDNIVDSSDRHLIIVVNDNGHSYAPTIRELVHHLDALRANPGYERVLSGVKRTLLSQDAPGRAASDVLHGLKRRLKDVLVPSAFFGDLGIRYTGPVDGHDITAVEFTLTRAHEYAEPVIVHVTTEKGRGYTPAEEHIPDRFYAVGQIHPETGLPVVAERFGWIAVFAEEIVSLARGDGRIVEVTVTMQVPVGLQPLVDEMPTRVIDVGTAEQHALTFSTGLAFAGMHPATALYATFPNRAFDQVLMDVVLHRAGVTIILNRVGITGTDGASHNGMRDMALLAHVPGLRLATPRDEVTLRESLRTAVSTDDAPTVVRYPKSALPEPLTALRRLGPESEEPGRGGDPVHQDTPSVSVFDVVDVPLENRRSADGTWILLMGVDAMATQAYEAGRLLEQEGHAVTVVYPHWAIPAPAPLVTTAADVSVVVVVEGGLVDGDIGSQLRDTVEEYQAAHSATGGSPVFRRVGVSRQFVDTATRAQLIEDFGMRAADIAQTARRAADGATGLCADQDLRAKWGNAGGASAPARRGVGEIRRDTCPNRSDRPMHWERDHIRLRCRRLGGTGGRCRISAQ